MSAPPLPETFGNYALGDFIEVVSPQAVSWLPQTTGWWWVGAGLLVMTLRYGWRHLRHWYRNRYRREASARLQQLSGTQASTDIVSEINTLLKLTALVAYSREQVARLSGEDWVDFLNGQCATPPFAGELGQLLALGVYRRQPLDSGQTHALITASGTWIEQHRGIDDV
jgi:hypothetical protein